MPITITSRFKPLTYDEITRPLIEQTQAQAALEDAYMQASDQAAQIMAQANQQTDPVAYARLKNYSDELQQQADSLMRQGLNRNSRQSLLNIRRKYNQNILPVQTAINRRNELMEERRKLQLTNPDMMWERDMLSIDDLLQNPQLDYGKTISGSDITKRAAAITSAIGKGRQSIALGKNLDKYTQTVLSQSGLTAEEIQAALSGDDSALDKALGNLYASTGVENWKSQASKDRVRGFIQEGAMQGVGDVKISTQRDANQARRDQLADREYEYNKWLKQKGLKEENGHVVIDTESPLYQDSKSKAKTTTGETITIESVGKRSTRYGDVARATDGKYYRRVGSQWEEIEDQEDAAVAFKEGNPVKITAEKDNLTPAQRRQREEFSGPAYNGMMRVGKNMQVQDKAPDEIEREIEKALSKKDTNYYTAANVPNKEAIKELIKGTGYGLDDFYYIYDRNWVNHYIFVLKEKASDALKAKYGDAPAAPEAPKPEFPVINIPSDTTTVRSEVENIGLRKKQQ